jgi:hypothetical protein
MPDEMPNLWPEDLGGDQNVVTPTTVLKEAAAQLGRQTRQLVRARVSTDVRGDSLEHTFWIEVPSLEYRYELFRLQHPVDSFYPLHTGQWVDRQEVVIRSEDELKEYLRDIFGSEHTKRLVGTLLRQVRS